MTKGTLSTQNNTTAVFVELAREVVPEIKRAVRAINRKRKFPSSLTDAMLKRGLFKLLVPKSVGGNEIDYLEFLEVLEVVARADGSVGWCINQNNVLATIAAFMPKELAIKIWADPRVVLANGSAVSAEAIRVERGFLLGGRWNFSSGFSQATWVVALTSVKESDHASMATREMRNMMIPKEQVDMVDAWQVNGLRGTGSFSFRTQGLFVPNAHTFVDSNTPREEGPIYRIPKSLLFSSGFATVALSVARSGLDFAIELSRTKMPREQSLLMSHSSTQREIGQAEAIWRSARAFFRATAEEAWERAVAKHVLPIETRINLRLASTHAIRESARVIDMAYAICGATAIFEDMPIQRHFQDIHAISQQVQGRMAHYDTAGQHYLGMDPDSRFF